MVRGYSNDLRARAVALVEEGESRREVARLLNVAASTAVRWLNLWTTTGSVEDKPCAGHSRSPLKAHEDWLLHLVAKEPDLTLEEIRKRLRREKKTRRRRELCVALLRPPRDHVQKKVLHACEQDRPDVAATREALKAEQPKLGATQRFLPAYSPDLNPIENLYAKVKSDLRKGAARTVDALSRLVGRSLKAIAPSECAGYFRHAGYRA